MMACFGFVEDFSCQYDPPHIISKRRKKQKRGNYEHQVTPEMEKMANMLILPSDQERKNQVLNLVTTPSIPTDAKGKRKIGQDVAMTGTTNSSVKKPKLFKDAFLQVVDYPTPTMESTKGKEVDTEQTLLKHYSSLKIQASQERELTKERLGSTQAPQLISALDKKSQMMKIIVIRPQSTEDPQNKKIT